MENVISQDDSDEKDLFKGVYKKYKRRDRPLDTSDVIDFHSGFDSCDGNVTKFELTQPKMEQFPGMKPFKDWKAYQIKSSEGFIVIPNPFEDKYQRYWIKRCLLDFPTKPNRTNIDAHSKRPSHIWQKDVFDGKPNLEKDSFLMRLRWATLGFQYEWNTKEYFSDRVQFFPDDLSHMCSYIAETLGYSEYSSEAGIVNFYRMDSTLMGHTDVSELDKAAPLISFSFGQSCIFLIGGPTKATEPTSLFLHSGDICLMTRKARLSFHAVPRIMPGDTKELQQCFYGEDKSDCEVRSADDGASDDSFSSVKEDDPYNASKDKFPVSKSTDNEVDEYVNEPDIVTETAGGNKCSLAELSSLMDKVVNQNDWSGFQKYLNISRVNVNVRQVLKAGFELGKCPDVIKTCQK